jgi:ribonuclease HI
MHLRVKIHFAGVGDQLGGPAGWGVVLTHDDVGQTLRKELSGSFKNTSITRVEMIAAIEGLKALKNPSWATFYSTSEYFIRALNEGWVDHWHSSNWHLSPLERPRHVDLWIRLLLVLQNQHHEAIFVRVEQKEWVPEVNRADQLARAALNDQVDQLTDEGYNDPDNQGDGLLDFAIRPPLCPHCSSPLVPKMSKNSDPFDLCYVDYYLLCPGCKVSYLVPEILKHFPACYLLPKWS